MNEINGGPWLAFVVAKVSPCLPVCLSVCRPICLSLTIMRGGGGLRVKPVNLSIDEHIIGGDDVRVATPLGTQTDTLIPQAERSFQHRANI